MKKIIDHTFFERKCKTNSNCTKKITSFPQEKSRQLLIEQLYSAIFPTFTKQSSSSYDHNKDMIMDFEETTITNNKNEKLLDIIIRSEERTYRRFLGDLPKYGNHMKIFLEALKDPSNELFREKIINGTISPEKVCKLKYKHMANPKEKKQLKEEKEIYIRKRDEFIRLFEKYGYWEENMEEKELQKQMLSNQDDLLNSYVCRKCGSKQLTYEQKQTRSADEPMTVFITCLKCNTMWKE